ncbi:hypothetical protein AAKU55_001150 [Oxalobacteraceae bacterium GrIS 1.11]
MTYEEYLDEVTTLITEKYNVADEAAIKMVTGAQAGNFFVVHDRNDTMRNLDRAHKDAKTLYEASLKK